MIKHAILYLTSSFLQAKETVHTIYFEQNTLLLTISIICTLTILGFFYKITLNKNMHTYLKIINKHNQLLDNPSIGEDIQNNFNIYLNMIKMQFAKKIRGGANLLYKNITNITIEDIKLYLAKFDEDVLPSFLFGLIIICLLMGVIYLIFDSRIIEEINYPNLVGVLIQRL